MGYRQSVETQNFASLLMDFKVINIGFYFIDEQVFLDDFLVFVEEEHIGDGSGVKEVVVIDGLVEIPALQVVGVGLTGMDVVVPNLRIILKINHHHLQFAGGDSSV